MGHAAFEFMEARYGKEGIRQFLYTLRKGILGGTIEDIYKQAFRTTPEEFDQAFDKWLKERFKPFRDKERPSDYGRDLSPNPEKTSFTQVFGFAPSPSGEMVAAITADRNNGKATIVLLSARDGQLINHLTPGFPKEYENLSINEQFVAGRSIGFDPRGDAVAFFGRVNKGRTLFLVSVLDGRVLRSIPVKQDLPQAPALLPDGRHVIYAGLREGVSDIWMLDMETGEARNLTKDDYADTDPQVSPDGKLVVYTRRISGHDKVYSFPLDNPAKKTQLTFGAFDDSAPTFSSDGKKIYYASDEDNDIPNVRSLDLETGVIYQYTDVLGGNMAPAPLRREAGRPAGLHQLLQERVQAPGQGPDGAAPEVEQEVQSADEGIVDFQPDLVAPGGPREQAQEADVRGPLPRGAAAHQRGRDLERRLLRGHRGRPDRRAGRPQLHVHRPLHPRVPDLRGDLHQPREAPPLRVLAASTPRASSTPRPTASRRASSARGRSPPSATPAVRSSASTRSTSSGASRCPRG